MIMFNFNDFPEFNDSSSVFTVNVQNDFWRVLENKKTWLDKVQSSQACILVIKLANSFIKWTPEQLKSLIEQIDTDYKSGVLKSNRIDNKYAIVLTALPSKMVEGIFFLDEEYIAAIPDIEQKCECCGFAVIKK